MHDAVRLTKAVPYPGMHDAAVPPADYCTMSCIAAAAALLAPARGVRARWLVPYKKIAVSVRASVRRGDLPCAGRPSDTTSNRLPRHIDAPVRRLRDRYDPGGGGSAASKRKHEHKLRDETTD